MTEAAIRTVGLTKTFGRNEVLRGIDLSIPAGRVTVLMGANGAGKSTLVKILCGVHPPTGGQVLLDGQPFRPANPARALRAGVVTVHQNINDGVVPALDVASNLMLDHLADGGQTWLAPRRLRRQAQAIADAVGLAVDLRRPVADLSLADRQLVSIARAMAHKPRLLILDEPTSSLSATEADRLFRLIEGFRADGVAILYISHRMSDIRRIADRIVAMRDGQISGLFEEAPLDTAGAVRAMLGHALTEADIAIPPDGKPVLTLNGITLRDGAAPITDTFRDGEVVAITGLVGAGKSALAGVLFGTDRARAGRMTLDGSFYTPKGPADAIRQGVFLAAKDRRVNAVVPDFDIARNLSLPFTRAHARALSFLSRRSERALAGDVIDTMGVVCQGPGDNILTLSGGNQQKVMIGRWLSAPSRVLILDEPFQGVDIQARRDIGARIRATAAGRATIVFCSEIDEALEIADRILVMADHTIAGRHRNDRIDLTRLMAEVTGAAMDDRKTA